MADVAELIRLAGAQPLYLPPYSPDFNPIEKMWSKLKALFPKLKLRLLELLTAAIPAAFCSITSADSYGWFSLSGY